MYPEPDFEYEQKVYERGRRRQGMIWCGRRLSTIKRTWLCQVLSFWVKKGDTLFCGAHVGILVARGRMQMADGQLTDRARSRIKAMHAQFETIA